MEIARSKGCRADGHFVTMCRMKLERTRPIALFALPILALAIASITLPARAQTGSVEFVARATPSSGIAEPIRGLPFYLLSKSYVDIRKEAEASQPKPDLDAYVDKLDVSTQLKAWMKKNKTLSISGEEFIKLLTVSDIMNVPEFFKAYVERNAGDQSIKFPQPKYTPRDMQKNPDRYEKLHQEYLDAVRKFLTANPDSTSGMDLNLDSIDPGPAWRSLVAKRDPAVKSRALELAQTRYLVAKTETDLDGRGALRGVAPGNYWLGTLEIYATIGDARLQWDAPVRVSAGKTAYVELTNSNAAEPRGSAH
jgi:hypothetical protein